MSKYPRPMSAPLKNSNASLSPHTPFVDEEFDTYILDDDKLIDTMEPMVESGGCVVDFHTCDVFPERWFDLVLVLRANTDVLFDRLTERGYSDKKRNENMEVSESEMPLTSLSLSPHPATRHNSHPSCIPLCLITSLKLCRWS